MIKRLAFFLPVILSLLLVASLYLVLSRAPSFTHTPTTIFEARPVPAFTLGSLTEKGTYISEKHFAGTPYIVHFFASWCVTCLAEHELLLALHNKHHVQILGIAWKDEDTKTLAWLEQHGNSYTHVVADHKGSVAIDFGISGVPETYVVGKDGMILYKMAGPLSAEMIEKEILPLL